MQEPASAPASWEQKIAQATDLVLENRRLNAQIQQLKQASELQITHLQQELTRLGSRAQQRNTLNAVLDRYLHMKQNQERSIVSEKLPGVILGRPSILRNFLASQDQEALRRASSDAFPEFGFRQAPVFPKAAAEELKELQVLGEAWQVLQPRYEELLQAQKQAAEFEHGAAAAAPETVAREVSGRSEIGSTGSLESGL